MRQGGAAALALALCAGCATHGGVTTAHPIGKGNVQVGLEPGAAFLATPDDRVAWAPTVNAAVRYGLSDRVDIGGRLGTTAYELFGKVQLNAPGADVPVSIAPSGHFIALGGQGHRFGYLQYQVPLLIGIPLGDDQLVVGPKVRHMGAVSSVGDQSGGGMLLLGGGTVAYSLKAGERFRFHPELSVDVPILGAGVGGVGGEGGIAVGGGIGSALVGFNLGLLFGGN